MLQLFRPFDKPFMDNPLSILAFYSLSDLQIPVRIHSVEDEFTSFHYSTIPIGAKPLNVSSKCCTKPLGFPAFITIQVSVRPSWHLRPVVLEPPNNYKHYKTVMLKKGSGKDSMLPSRPNSRGKTVITSKERRHHEDPDSSTRSRGSDGGAHAVRPPVHEHSNH